MSREPFESAPSDREPEEPWLSPPRDPIWKPPIDNSITGMAEVEEQIKRCNRRLIELGEEHLALAPEAGRAKSNWLRHLGTVTMRVQRSGERSAADTREAQAREETDPVTGQPGADLYETYKILDYVFDAQKTALRAVEATLNGWQSVGANIRAVST